jgi:hypothetical protein
MAVEESLWSLRLPNGDVRSGTIEQLQEAFRAGHVAGNSPVLSPGAREWVSLDTIAVQSQPVTVRPAPVVPVAARIPAQANNDIWQVRLASGEVRAGTRQQLDEAFRAGHIDGGSLALPAGARDWMRLDSVLQTRDVATAPPIVSPSQAPPVAQPAPQRAEDVDDVCHVKVPRAQLEEAFRAGFLDEGILVLTPEASDWVKLGSLVDRGAAPSATSRQAAVSQTGEWPPLQTDGLAGNPLPPPAQTEPALGATSQEEPFSEPGENENGLASGKVTDDETPSMPSLT